MSHENVMRIGMAGLGGVARKVLPILMMTPGLSLAAAADVRAQARREFADTFRLPAYDSVDALCEAKGLDAIYIATPNRHHFRHSLLALSAGKHVICEKPMALSVAECERMIEVSAQSGLQLVQGYSRHYDARIRAIKDTIDSGALGSVIQIDTWNFNDWMLRPRVAEELDTDSGGGVVFRQAPIQIEIALYLMGSTARSVRAVTGRWDTAKRTEGNFSALLQFDGGRAAMLSYNGYGFFDVSELLPRGRTPTTCPPVHSTANKVADKYETLTPLRKLALDSPNTGHLYPGLFLVSCERGLIRQSEKGFHVYTKQGVEEIHVEKNTSRADALMDLRDAVSLGRNVRPGGQWGRSIVEVCVGIRESARRGTDIPLSAQSPP